jgi:mono/diheme cytochrome c family protein
MTDKLKQKSSNRSFLISRLLIGTILLLVVIAFQYTRIPQPSIAAESIASADAAAGAELLALAGCIACHTNLDNYPYRLLAGGVAIDTPFGAFYPPNISADPDLGIGQWTLQDFDRAVRRGQNPDGMPYYPTFPYVAYSGLSDQDIVNMWAAIQIMPRYKQPAVAHDISFPFSIRPLMIGWQTLYFSPEYGPKVTPTVGDDRAAYLVNHVMHCVECHSPRSRLGVIVPDRKLSGGTLGKSQTVAADIRASALLADGWSTDDLDMLLGYGMLPNGDFVGSYMSEVTDATALHLGAQDLNAVTQYLLKP